MLVFVGALVACAGCAETPPAGFVSKEHKFKADFGSRPKFSERTGATGSAVYTVETTDGALTVTVTELPIPDDDPPDRVPAYLDSAKDDLIRAAGGKQLASASVTLAGKYPGREFAARFGGAKPGVLRARIFLVGKRLYLVMAIGTEVFVNSDAATAFIESFMVTE
jgi:hypothetical protein